MSELRHRVAEVLRRVNTSAFGDGPAEDWGELADAVLAAFDVTEKPPVPRSEWDILSRWFDEAVEENNRLRNALRDIASRAPTNSAGIHACGGPQRGMAYGCPWCVARDALKPLASGSTEEGE